LEGERRDINGDVRRTVRGFTTGVCGQDRVDSLPGNIDIRTENKTSAKVKATEDIVGCLVGLLVTLCIGLGWWLLPPTVPLWAKIAASVLLFVLLGGFSLWQEVRKTKGLSATAKMHPSSAQLSTQATLSTFRHSPAAPIGRDICSHCGKPYGEMASLSFQLGGYQCNTCGARSCDRCCYQKAKAMGRATILCTECGSENMQAFRVPQTEAGEVGRSARTVCQYCGYSSSGITSGLYAQCPQCRQRI
jgi:hypothetical protein